MEKMENLYMDSNLRAMLKGGVIVEVGTLEQAKAAEAAGARAVLLAGTWPQELRFITEVVKGVHIPVLMQMVVSQLTEIDLIESCGAKSAFKVYYSDELTGSSLVQTEQLRSRPISLLVAGSSTSIVEVSNFLRAGCDAIVMGCKAFDDNDPTRLIMAVVGAAREFLQPTMLADILISLEKANLKESMTKVVSFDAGDGCISPGGLLGVVVDVDKSFDAGYGSISPKGPLMGAVVYESPDPVLDTEGKKVSPNPAPLKKQKVNDAEAEKKSGEDEEQFGESEAAEKKSGEDKEQLGESEAAGEKSGEEEQQLWESEELVIPSELCCELTGQMFFDPVITPGGRTYEREALLVHLREYAFDPVTHEELKESELKDDRRMWEKVEQFAKTHGLEYFED